MRKTRLKRKTPLKRSRKPLKRSPLRRVSLKRKKQLAAYYSVRRAFLRDNRFCEAFIMGHCSIRATEIHHMKRRHGEKLNDDEWFLPVCANCHRWIEDNKREARKKGLILYK